MKKNEFLDSLRQNLKCLPKQDLVRIIDYYNEMIEDKIDAGESEETAVFSVGTIEEITVETLKESGREKLKKSFNGKRQLVYLIIGAPLWVPLLIAALCTVLVCYISAWATVFSIAVTEVSLLIASPLEVIAAIITMFVSSVPLGFVELGIAICGIGLSILVLPYVIKCVKYSVDLTKLSVLKFVKLIKGGVKNEG